MRQMLTLTPLYFFSVDFWSWWFWIDFLWIPTVRLYTKCVFALSLSLWIIYICHWLHIAFPTFVFIFISIFIQRLTPFHHSFIHSFTTLNWIRQKLIRFEGEAKKSMDLQRDNKTLEGQDPSLTYMVLLFFRWVTWSQIRAKCVFTLHFLL